MAAYRAEGIPAAGRHARDRIVICKSCGKTEWSGQMRGFSGQCICRNCYRSSYERKFLKVYTWDDLDGPRPTVEEYNIQEREDKNNGTY